MFLIKKIAVGCEEKGGDRITERKLESVFVLSGIATKDKIICKNDRLIIKKKQNSPNLHSLNQNA